MYFVKIYFKVEKKKIIFIRHVIYYLLLITQYKEGFVYVIKSAKNIFINKLTYSEKIHVCMHTRFLYIYERNLYLKFQNFLFSAIFKITLLSYI